MYMEMTVEGYLKELASDSPAPGGGSVSALAGSLGAALVAMVARLTAGRGAPEEQEQQIRRSLEKSILLQHTLQKDADGDIAAYNGVVAAYAMPKGTEAQKAARSRAIQEGLQEATRLPLQVAQGSLDVLRLALWALSEGNPNTRSDAVVAVLMAQGGIQGALANVSINLGSIRDAGFVEKAKAQAEEIRCAARQLKEKIEELLPDC